MSRYGFKFIRPDGADSDAIDLRYVSVLGLFIGATIIYALFGTGHEIYSLGIVYLVLGFGAEFFPKQVFYFVLMVVLISFTLYADSLVSELGECYSRCSSWDARNGYEPRIYSEGMIAVCLTLYGLYSAIIIWIAHRIAFREL